MRRFSGSRTAVDINLLVVWMEEDPLDPEDHLPVLCLVHAVLSHHHSHDVHVLAAPELTDGVHQMENNVHVNEHQFD